MIPKKRDISREPTKAEREQHEITHMPYRSWCEHCVRGKAVGGHHHRRIPEDMEGRIPMISMDYMYMRTSISDDGDHDTMPILVIRDMGTRMIFSFAVPQKGVDTYAVRRCKKVIELVSPRPRFHPRRRMPTLTRSCSRHGGQVPLVDCR